MVITACAVPAPYSPFGPGERLVPSLLAELDSAWDGKATVPRRDDFVHKAEKITHLRIDWAADGTAELLLSRNGEKLFSGPLKGYGSAAVGADVYTADLNADGQPDYAIITHSGGNGLSSQCAWITFLLSVPGGYGGTSLSCWAADASDLIEIEGRFCLVHTSFIQGNKGKDGKTHNYWVYNLLGFSGAELVLANDGDRRFPKWVWYSFAENHRDTDQLSPAQRRLSLKQIVEAD